MRETDTIAAIATAPGNSGISIVRISGEEAIQVADRIFQKKKGSRPLSEEKSHTIHYGFIHDEDEIVDEVLLMLMRGPKSYTAEDTVEIDSHGGMLVTRRILETVLKAGARLAEPGEFTKRAFLNGRIDLSQAEAVIDVINSKNEYALKSSMGQLRGSVSRKIRSLRETILYEIAFIESALDDPEHISLDGYGSRLEKTLSEVEKELEQLTPFIGPPLTDSFESFYGFTHEQALEGVRVYREYFSVQGWRENREYAGIREMLEALKRAGLSLFVATSKPEVYAKRILDYFSMTEYFDFVGGADLEGKRVRKADVIRYTLAGAGLGEDGGILKQAVMVGDREHDILGAKAVGLASVGVLYGYGSRGELEAAGADAIVETPRELAQLFVEL